MSMTGRAPFGSIESATASDEKRVGCLAPPDCLRLNGDK